MKTLTIGKLAAIILSVVFSVTAVAIAVPAIVVSVRESANTQPSEGSSEALTDGGEAADEPSTAAPVETIMRCDSDSGKKLIKSMVLRTADRQGMC